MIWNLLSWILVALGLWTGAAILLTAGWAVTALTGRWRRARHRTCRHAACACDGVRRRLNVPGLPRDGRALTSDEGDQFAALIYAYRHSSIPEPSYDQEERW